MAEGLVVVNPLVAILGGKEWRKISIGCVVVNGAMSEIPKDEVVNG
jgi:hypothetical protein